MGIAQHPNWGQLFRASKYIDGELVQAYARTIEEARELEAELERQKIDADQVAKIRRQPTRRGGSTPLRGIYLMPASKNRRAAFGVRTPPTSTSILKFGAACAWWQSCGILAESLDLEAVPLEWLTHLPLMIEKKIRFIQVGKDEIHEYAPYWAHEGRIRAAELLQKPAIEAIYLGDTEAADKIVRAALPN